MQAVVKAGKAIFFGFPRRVYFVIGNYFTSWLCGMKYLRLCGTFDVLVVLVSATNLLSFYLVSVS